MTDLERLLERVGNATEPDREIDERLFALAWGWSYPIHGAARHEFDELGHDVVGFSSSLDAIVGLISTDLPDGERWSISIDSRLQNQPWACYIEDEWAANRNGLGNGATRALALCAAYLHAKLALPQKDSA